MGGEGQGCLPVLWSILLLTVTSPVGSEGGGVLAADSASSSQTPNDCQRELWHQTESIETLFRLNCNLRWV